MLGIKETVFSFHSRTIRCRSGVRRRVPDTRKPLHLVKVSDLVEVKSGNQSNKQNGGQDALSSSPVGAGDALSPSRVVGAGVARGGGAGDARGGGAGDALEAGAVSLVGARSSLPSMYLMAASIRVPGRGVCLLSQLTNLKKKREQS